MNVTARLSSILAAAVLAAGTGQAYASSVLESEPNNPFANAQVLRGSTSELQVSGALSKADDPNDVDFFRFFAQAGDVLTVDIDQGFGAGESVDTVIGIFDSAGSLLRAGDDASVDPGSYHAYDARIDGFVVPATGMYTVGVSSYPRYFTHGGSTWSGYVDEGDYVLVISGVSVPNVQISMVIKPGNDNVSPPFNPRSKGKLPVALLGSKDFDVRDVDQQSLTFGATGNERSLHKCSNNYRDVNRDGHRDLVCHFYTEKAGFGPSSLEGHVKGRTGGGSGARAARAGSDFEGSAWLKVVPAKTKD
ncbi:MAG: hypothetical protein GTO28_00215 [Gammaproteobacteria bacterium]|nr:hypothetical protein [Gammaproteobacteria bacterium]NIM71641.1 hypothetical protein [Gammaproteobacteria bacterium]NIO23381.1 hypothetical protein [Gammaproteobacteria bacterium]NIO64009.1 hypothetical protein [Gammaproteobacteria bacterium]NIP47102.1 hypothetical protein [Gammaproteobacteria bacterium]